MNLASRITRTPDAHDPDLGAAALARFPDIDGPLADLIAGAAGCSPYLGRLMERESDWIGAALDDPEAAMAALLAGVATIPPDRLAVDLRQAKARVALMVALADLGGVWPLETVTRMLTDFADAAADVAMKGLLAADIGRGRLPMLTADDVATGGGMAALAMGKMGAGELNYSSDIDLICLFDESRFDAADTQDARAGFIRIVKRLAGVLSDNTADGYVFRTDLRLRPDAAVTPVCLSMEAAESYYESVGRTWERAAYIKARPCAGDLVAGQGFLDRLRPFVWRKHLDFAAIQDAHDMRLRIRDHKGLHGPLVLDGHNMKLGRGGIREIEFFTQTRQLIAGGRDPGLRGRDTVGGLGALARAGWVPQDDATTLCDHYRFHREIEHRLQMIADQQTQDLPTNAEGFARLAAFMGRDVAGLRTELTDRLEQVHTLTEGFFAPGVTPTPTDNFGADTITRWRTYPALRSARAVEIFKRLRPGIMAKLAEAAKPDEALIQFDGFLAGLPAGVQLFSLFDANPQLTGLIVDICATAPALAQYLSRNADVFDAVIGGGFFSDWPGTARLTRLLTRAMSESADYEARLDMARRWTKEWHFRTGVHHLRGLITADEAGAQYADLAEAVVAGLWPLVVAEFARKYGPSPGRGAVVLGMGSLGAGRLNATSDLDLIVIYDNAGVAASEGPRSLASRPYYARLTQALVTALTAPMGEGKLYEVDMRLRPSGRQGPVATSLTAFVDYQQTEAWTWEHLALTRARPVAGDAALGAEVAAFRQSLLAAKADGATVLADVADMRDRIAAARQGQGIWDVKNGPGRLQDIELLAQTAALRAGSAANDLAGQIGAGVASGWLNAADAGALSAAAGLFWRVQAAARLLTGGVIDPEILGEGGRRMMLRETGFDDIDGLQRALAAASDSAATIIAAHLEGS